MLMRDDVINIMVQSLIQCKYYALARGVVCVYHNSYLNWAMAKLLRVFTLNKCFRPKKYTP